MFAARLAILIFVATDLNAVAANPGNEDRNKMKNIQCSCNVTQKDFEPYNCSVKLQDSKSKTSNQTSHQNVTCEIHLLNSSFCTPTTTEPYKSTANATTTLRNGNNGTREDKSITIQRILKNFENPEFIIFFSAGIVIGIILTAIIACLAAKCHRKKKSRNLAEGLEMVTTQGISEVDRVQDPEAAEGGAESDGLLAPDSNVAPTEAEYSDIDFSALRRNKAAEEDEKQETTETEYAEIKREDIEDRQVSEGEEGHMLVGNEENEAMVDADELVNQSQSISEPAEGVYPNIKEIMDET